MAIRLPAAAQVDTLLADQCGCRLPHTGATRGEPCCCSLMVASQADRSIGGVLRARPRETGLMYSQANQIVETIFSKS